jgi:hypothetical protein
MTRLSSKQSSTTSRTRFVSVSRFLACVMAASQGRNGDDIRAVFVPFDDDRGFSLRLHDTVLARRKPGPPGVVSTGLALEARSLEPIDCFTPASQRTSKSFQSRDGS